VKPQDAPTVPTAAAPDPGKMKFLLKCPAIVKAIYSIFC